MARIHIPDKLHDNSKLRVMIVKAENYSFLSKNQCYKFKGWPILQLHSHLDVVSILCQRQHSIDVWQDGNRLTSVVFRQDKTVPHNRRFLPYIALHILHSVKVPLFLLMLCCYSCLPGFVEAKGTLPRVLVLSYTNHPTTQKYYLPLVLQAYHNLGIEIQLVEVATERFIQLYQQGKIDGDIARIKALTQLLPQLLLVQQLDQMQVSYHCSAVVSCSPTDLNDPHQLIFTPVVKKVRQLIKLEVLAKTYEVNSWQQLLELYQQNKVDRFLMVDGKRFRTTLKVSPQRFEIPHTPLPFYHVLHHQHRQLAPLVAEQIQKALANYPPLPAQ